jgi:hypothetical protein
MIRVGPNPPTFVCRSASLAGGLFAVAFAAFSPSIGHAACKEWKLDQFELIQTNGFFVRVYPAEQSGGQFGGGARYYFRDSEGVYDSVPGQVEGNISGEDISFTIHWNNGPVGEYTGHVSPQGFLDGETRDRLNPESKARWSMRPFADSGTMEPAAKCLDVATAPSPPAPPPAPASPLDEAGVLKEPGTGIGDIFKKTTPPASPAAPSPGGNTATVKQDVDVYAKPGGVGEPIGVLREKSIVSLLEVRPDQWCHVEGNAVPNGSGWVWCAADFLQF